MVAIGDVCSLSLITCVFIVFIYADVTEQVYVSYYADSERYHSSLQNLVAKLRRAYSVNLIMDSYCQTEVAELGLARWCQRKLSVSTRIVMVVSKEYLKVGSLLQIFCTAP